MTEIRNAAGGVTFGGRWSCLDRARGLAIVLMVLDHVLAMVDALGAGDGPVWLRVVRLTATRASLPLFMVCTGVLAARVLPSRRRLLEVAGAALFVQALLAAYPNGVLMPDVLFVWLVVMAFAPLIVAHPVGTVCVGLVQVTVWPVGWDGYQPGMVAALIAAGVLGGPLTLGWADRLPAGLSAVGRRPLAWYCGHLVVLSAFVAVVR